MGYLDIDFIPLSVFLHHVASKGNRLALALRARPRADRVVTSALANERRSLAHPTRPGYAGSDVVAAARTYTALLRSAPNKT